MKYFCLVILFCLFACQTSTDKVPKKDNSYLYYKQNIGNQVVINYYNYFQNTIYSSSGVMISSNQVLALLPPSRKDVYSVRISYSGQAQEYDVRGYNAIDLKQGIYVLQLEYDNNQYHPHVLSHSISSPVVYCLKYNREKQILVARDTLNKENQLHYPPLDGTPLYNSAHELQGMSRGKEMIPISSMQGLLDSTQVSHLYPISHLSEEGIVYPSIKEVKGFKLITSYGDITIRLFDDLPEYKENFIKLVTKGYYDSLLIHRVIPNFLIQTGSSDSRDAQPGDDIGRSGPGYMLPNKPLRKYFHKRGAVAASKLPFFENIKNECDAGQFYIIAGRTFTAKELSELEKEKDYKYSPTQKTYYETIGGAPHLDGEFTVFGEVSAGMEVVDKITKAPINDRERPIKDIKLYRIIILK